MNESLVIPCGAILVFSLLLPYALFAFTDWLESR